MSSAQITQSIKLIFCDFDGTLFWYHGLGKKLLREILAERRIPFDEEAYSKLPHYNAQDKLKLFFPEHYEALWPELDKRFSERVVVESEAYPETRKFLQQVHSKKIPLIIVSTKFARHIHNILKHHHLDSYVTEVIGRETVEPPKPHPKGILDTLKKYNASKKNCVYVGDSYLDGEQAKNANIRFVHISRKPTREEIPTPWKTINTLTELSNLL